MLQSAFDQILLPEVQLFNTWVGIWIALALISRIQSVEIGITLVSPSVQSR